VRESVDAALPSRDGVSLAASAEALAAIAVADGDPPGAARLLGLAERIRGASDRGGPDVARRCPRPERRWAMPSTSTTPRARTAPSTRHSIT
jgi:hypothetical protein